MCRVTFVDLIFVDRFKDKYDPEVLEKKRSELFAVVQENFKAFIIDNEQGKIDFNIETDLYYTEEASTASARRHMI